MKNLLYKSIDVMKKSKDTVNNQLTTGEKQSLINCLAHLGATHIAISVPLDANSVFTDAGNTPSSRTVEAEVQDWCDVIHAQNNIYGSSVNNGFMRVIHRGSFCGVENIYNVAFDKVTPSGTAASSSTDGLTTWCGRYYNYLYTSVGTHVATGDIFAPIPEGTTHAFDGNWFMPNQAAYLALFPEFHTITNTYATAKSVTLVFQSHNNFSECASGYLSSGLFSDQALVGADYYGQRQGSTKVQAADYVYDWQQLYLGKDSNGGGNNGCANQDQFWGEWGDLSSAVPAGVESNNSSWAVFLNQFYSAIRDNLVTPNGHLIGFNYWGGWEGQNTSILNKSGSGDSSVYTPNFRGDILRTYFIGPYWETGIK